MLRKDWQCMSDSVTLIVSVCQSVLLTINSLPYQTYTVLQSHYYIPVSHNLNIPTVTIPTVTIPTVTIPTVTIPTVTIPTVTFLL